MSPLIASAVNDGLGRGGGHSSAVIQIGMRGGATSNGETSQQ
jgi:hypothetical protein